MQLFLTAGGLFLILAAVSAAVWLLDKRESRRRERLEAARYRIMMESLRRGYMDTINGQKNITREGDKANEKI